MQELDILSGDGVNQAEARATRAKILANLHMQLRKVCQHPFLVNGVETLTGPRTAKNMLEASGKLAVLDLLLRSLFAKKHRVVLFSQFTAMLDLIADYCSKRGWNFCCYDGRTPRARRNYYVNAFNAPDSPFFIFLMSTRAGNLGCKYCCVPVVSHPCSPCALTNHLAQ